MAGVKKIIDDHFEKYIDYYKSISYSLFNGRYLYEDLCQEIYLGLLNVPEKTILQFHEQNKLHFLGGKVAYFIFTKRGNKKNHVDGCTSPLYEECNLHEYERIDSADDEVTSKYKQIDNKVLTNAIIELGKKDSYQMKIFILSKYMSINSISLQSRTNRRYVGSAYKEAKRFIKQYIENELERTR